MSQLEIEKYKPLVDVIYRKKFSHSSVSEQDLKQVVRAHEEAAEKAAAEKKNDDGGGILNRIKKFTENT